MFNRITALVLCLVLAVSLIPGAAAEGRQPIAPESVDQCCSTLRVDTLDPNYTRPAYNGKLIDITPQRVEDTFHYLDEHYVKNHPEQALMVYTGTARDREALKKLAQTITKGCKTSRQKADAIGDWLRRNIYYDIDTSAYASDTFYRREGNCLSYANLMMFLLRSLGIPAVMGDGWRGDMTKSTVELFNQVGHAWVFVRLDGQWVLYDPLWFSGGKTDRDYMAQQFYFDCVETICPASDGDNLPPEAYDKPKAYYTDGKFYCWSKSFDNTLGVLTAFINNQAYAYVSNQCNGGISDDWYYLDGRDKTNMERGELYRNGWGSYGNYNKNASMGLTYFFPNAMTADGYVATCDGKELLMYCSTSNEILADNYDITDGLLTLKPGYRGPFLDVSWQENCVDSRDGYVITWESHSPDIVCVDQSGSITCLREGCAELSVTLARVEPNGDLTHMSNNSLTILVSNEKRVASYADIPAHNCVYVCSRTVPATCEDWGYDIHICTICGREKEVLTEDALGHNYSITVIKPTCVSGGCTTYTCKRCHNTYTDKRTPINPNAHAWNGSTCTLCKAKRLTSFDDVKAGAYYEVPVAWAVKSGITLGYSATEFGSEDPCKRSDVVTFLWRAAGKPNPKGTTNPFVDVKKGSYYEKAVLWATETGITLGYSATEFGPDDPCKRSEVVTFLWRFAGKPSASGKVPFTDVPANSWYYEPIIWAVKNGITLGMSTTEFGTNKACTRAQVVTFLYRAFGE